MNKNSWLTNSNGDLIRAYFDHDRLEVTVEINQSRKFEYIPMKDFWKIADNRGWIPKK